MAGTKDLQVKQSEVFNPDESRGLFVGINAYEDGEIRPLGFAVDDAIDLAFLFSCELELIAPDRLTLSLAGRPKKPATVAKLARLRAAGAREANFQFTDFHHQVYKLGKATGQGGLWLVTFSAHGLTDKGHDFIAVPDSRLRRIQATSLSVATLLDDISQATTLRRLLLLDTCRERLAAGFAARAIGKGFARAVPGGRMSPSLARAIAEAKGLSILSGAVTGRLAYEDEQLGNGVFTAAILSGLRGNAKADGNGLVTVGALAAYADGEVRRWVKRHYEIDSGISRTIEGMDLPLASRSPEDAGRDEGCRTAPSDATQGPDGDDIANTRYPLLLSRWKSTAPRSRSRRWMAISVSALVIALASLPVFLASHPRCDGIKVIAAELDLLSSKRPLKMSGDGITDVAEGELQGFQYLNGHATLADDKAGCPCSWSGATDQAEPLRDIDANTHCAFSLELPASYSLIFLRLDVGQKSYLFTVRTHQTTASLRAERKRHGSPAILQPSLPAAPSRWLLDRQQRGILP